MSSETSVCMHRESRMTFLNLTWNFIRYLAHHLFVRRLF